MESFEKEVITRLTKIETKLDNFDYKKIEDTSNKAMTMSCENKEDIDGIKDNTRWLWRTMLGSVIALIVNYLYKILK